MRLGQTIRFRRGFNKISLERGPQGAWGPRARGAPRTPFTLRTSFKGENVFFVETICDQIWGWVVAPINGSKK
jgi:hypothetical protein